ncbi:hypothetical protein EHI45_37510, partial [Rhizobium leguminosarum]
IRHRPRRGWLRVVTGLLFAFTMMIGVGLTLSVVAPLTVVFRDRIAYLMRMRPRLLGSVSRATGGLAGLVLVAVAAIEIANWLAFTWGLRCVELEWR